MPPTKKTRSSASQTSTRKRKPVGPTKTECLPAIVEVPTIPLKPSDVRLPHSPFSEREHVKLLYEALGLNVEELAEVKTVLLEALKATAAKDITVAHGRNAGSTVRRVQEDLANFPVRLEAAEKLLKLFDLFPKKGSAINISGSQVVVNPKFIKKK